MLAFFSIVTLAACLSLAKNSTYQLMEEIVPPRGWVKFSQPPADHTILLRIGLFQEKFSELERHLYEVSDPSHPRYGQHLSKEAVEALVAPNQDSVDIVDEWIASFGIGGGAITRSPAKDWVNVKIPIRIAEEMLHTKYYVWRHVETGDHLVRTTNYSLPRHIHRHVDVIQPTTIFSRFKPQKSMVIPPEPGAEIAEQDANTKKILSATGVLVDATCNRTVTILCLQQLYGALGYVPSDNVNNSIAVTGYLNDYPSTEDLQLFYADQRRDAINSTFESIQIKGGNINQLEPGIEANLDSQFAFGISYPIKSTFYTTGGSPPFDPDLITTTNTNEPYLDWLDYILSHPNPPLVISTSYGDDEQTVPKSYAQRACAGFAQLGARGVSLLFASGDRGVGDGDPDPIGHKCYTNDGQNKHVFIPAFPASCPYVTAVGATTGISPEVAVSRYYSGGGFSNYFPQPDYQKDVVSSYLRAMPQGTYQGLYNPQGRAYPDVAAQGQSLKIFHKGAATLIGGTSASSPSLAAFVALLNDVRLKQKLPSLGFLNPFIYSTGLTGFNDITIGTSTGCGTFGFNATTGWDPVTGHGTPNFEKLKALVLTAKITPKSGTQLLYAATTQRSLYIGTSILLLTLLNN